MDLAADFIFVEYEVAVSSIEVTQPLPLYRYHLVVLYPPYLIRARKSQIEKMQLLLMFLIPRYKNVHATVYPKST